MYLRFVGVVAGCLWLSSSSPGEDSAPLVAHEWGTFTVLQDDLGNPVDGVNINEESLPPFVHRLAADLTPDSHELAPLIGVRYQQPLRSKGIPRYYHAARMRMETPIIYLYPPADQPPRPISVDVGFHGGWITEWYPNASVDAPGYRERDSQVMAKLTPETTGRIRWGNVQTDHTKKPRSTDFPVWVAPRRTSASVLTTEKGEAEHYLFYRGVANLQAPLRVIRNDEVLTIHANADSTCQIQDFQNLKLWLVDVAPDGQLKFRHVSVDRHEPQSGDAIAVTSLNMPDDATGGLTGLRADMLASLIASGLFADEAEAMLNTWEASYFRTAGLRVFFTLPQAWTDRVLPLKLKGYENVSTVRTMIGRIELISPRQRQLLAKIAAGPVSNRDWFTNWLQDNQPDSRSQLYQLEQGTTTFDKIGLQPPSDYQAYMDLGRFRDAIIRHHIGSPYQPAVQQRHVIIQGPIISVHLPVTRQRKIDRFVITVPGENRIINLSEMELRSGGKRVTQLAKLTQSSNQQGKFPIENLVDGNHGSMSHTESERDPWIRVEFEEPLLLDEVRLWNRSDFEGRFASRFDGAQIKFFAGEEQVGGVTIQASVPQNLGAFATGYGLP